VPAGARAMHSNETGIAFLPVFMMQMRDLLAIAKFLVSLYKRMDKIRYFPKKSLLFSVIVFRRINHFYLQLFNEMFIFIGKCHCYYQ